MKPDDIMRRTLHGRRKIVASAIGVSPNAVDKMCEPARVDGGNGSRSFVERFITATRTLRNAGAETSEDLLLYVCGELGYFPPIRFEACQANPVSPERLEGVAREFADVVRTWTHASANGTLTVSIAENLVKELDDLLQVCGAWRLAARQFIAEQEEALVSERRPPQRCAPRVTLNRRATA